MTINDLTKTKLKDVDKFNVSKYPSSGIYLNTSETGLEEVIMVSTTDNITIWISHAMFNDTFRLLEYKPEKQDPAIEQSNKKPIQSDKPMVSEKFALKLVALVVNKEPYKNLRRELPAPPAKTTKKTK